MIIDERAGMNVLLTIGLSIIGSSAVFGFIQFLITRKDQKNATLHKISSRVEDINTGLCELSDKVDKNDEALREEMLRNQAIVARVRILRASDEILHRMKHSKEYFDQLNEDVTFYEDYCKDHPKFVNNKAVHAIASINEVYAKALKDNDFL